jgi:hypothetical protein
VVLFDKLAAFEPVFQFWETGDGSRLSSENMSTLFDGKREAFLVPIVNRHDSDWFAVTLESHRWA